MLESVGEFFIEVVFDLLVRMWRWVFVIVGTITACIAYMSGAYDWAAGGALLAIVGVYFIIRKGRR